MNISRVNREYVNQANSWLILSCANVRIMIAKKHTSIMLMLVFFRSMMRGVLLLSVDGVAGG